MSVVNGFQVGSDTLKYNYESLENYNTPEFSASSTYAVGDYVMHEGKLYRCTTAITTAGAWNSSKWTAAVLTDDVRDNSADCDGLVDHLVEVTDTEPTSDYNKVWIPETLPTGVQVPTYAEFTALEDRVDDVEEAVASVETSTTASKAYAVGDYFWKDDVLYVVTAAIASGGTITVNTNCKAAVLGNDVSSLKSALTANTGDYDGNMNIVQDLWEKGGLYVDGTNWNSNKYIRTKRKLPNTTARIKVATGYLGYLIGYNASGVCVGCWDQRTGYKTFNQQGQPFTEYVVDPDTYAGYTYRVFLGSSDSSVTDFPLSSYDAVTVYNVTHELGLGIDANAENIDETNENIVLNACINHNDADMWEDGTIDTATGTIVNSTGTIRTKTFLPKEIAFAHTDFNSIIRVFAYNQSGVYIGSWNPTTNDYDTTGGAVRDFAFDSTYKYKIVIQHETVGTISLSDYAKCTLYNSLQYLAENEKANTIKLTPNADCNDISLWAVNGYDITTGGRISWSGRIRTNDYVPDYVSFISTVDSDVNMWVLAYNSKNQYIGCWNWTKCAFDTNGQNCREFDIMRVKAFYPTYRYKLMVASANSSTSDYTVVKMVNYINRNMLLKGRTPVLTFIDDDGYAESAEIWEGLCDEGNISVDMALVTNQIDNVNYIVTSDTVKRLTNKSIEMISHTHNHINLNTETNPAVVRADFASTVQKLRDLYGTSNYLVYPYTQITSDNAAIVREYFLGGFAEGNKINTYNISKSSIGRVTINDGGTAQDIVVNGETIHAIPFKTLNDIKALLNKAYMTNGWIIFMTHLRNTYTGDGYYYTDDIGDMIVSACEYARDMGMMVLPVSKGYEVFEAFMY